MKYLRHVFSASLIAGLLLTVVALAAPQPARAVGSLQRVASATVGSAISGHVLDSDGQGVPGVDVMIFETSADAFAPAVATASTDASGSYSAVGVPDGVYEAWINPNEVSGWIGATAGGFAVVGGNVFEIDFLYDPVDTGSVQGTVEGDFGPLEGVQVTVDDTLTDSTTSDGAYRFDLLDAGSHKVEFASSGYVIQTVDFDVAVGEVSTVDATLDRDTYPVSGVVTDSEGHGIEGAPVGIYSGPPSDATLVASTTSDEDGYYWVQLPNGVYGAWIFPGGAGTGVPSIANPFVVAGTEVSDVNFTFDPAASGSLVGTVSGQGAGPLDGAMVSITDGPALATEPDGTYQFPSLTPGTYEVAFSAAGYNTTTETVRVDNGAETVQDATLSLAFGSISGVVTDETGPVAGVDVLVDGGGSTVTDVNGKYSLLDVDAGPQTLIFIKDGYAEQIIDTSVTSQENTVVDAVLVPITTGSISGVISDANGPLGGADVVLMPGGLTTTAEDGSYSFDALDPGDYKLAVTKDGYIDQVLDATVALGENTVVDSELAPVLGSIDGAVRDVHGPLSGVSVSIQGGPSTATDASGKYFLPSLPLGTYQVDYEKDGYLTVSDSLVVSDATAITNDVTMTVSVGSISGVVRDADGPIAGVDVVLMPGGLTTTASDGSYSFDALDAGPYKLAFSKDGYDAETVDTTVASGENTVVNAQLAPALGSFTGTVRDNHGPLAGVTVQVTGGTSTTTDGSGSYSLSDLAPGSYTLSFARGGFISAVHTATVSASETTTVNVTLVPSTHTLSYKAGANGSIVGLATQVVDHNASGTAVTAVPVGGYLFIGWSDGVTTPTRTDTAVGTDVSVTANFALTPPDWLPVWRFRSPKVVGSYLWSADPAEKANIMANLSKTWIYEGPAFNINRNNPKNSATMWRFRNKKLGTYFYTADPEEKANIIANLASTWIYEGPSWNVSRDSVGTIPVWRFRCLKKATYLWTSDPAEMQSIQSNLAGTYALEGVAYYIGQ